MASAASLLTDAFTSSVSTIEIRSRFSPPTVLDTKALTRPGPPNPILAALQPTIILNGATGRQVIAPYGQAGATDWQVPAALLVTAVGVGALVIGKALYKMGQRSGGKRRGVSGLGHHGMTADEHVDEAFRRAEDGNCSAVETQLRYAAEDGKDVLKLRSQLTRECARRRAEAEG